jgi:molybdenum cofactor biosynthesis protein A
MPSSSALVDRFGRRHTYLRISVTDRCNLRCRYCMPAEGLPWLERADVLSFEEIERLTRLFVSLGVTKLRLTGGEPTVRRELPRLIERLAGIPGVESLLMTTNGWTLARHAETYRNAGLTGLNVSIDSLKAEKYKEITRFEGLDRVMEGLDRAAEQGFEPLKVNVVLMAGVNEDELLDFIELARDRPINVRFIEFMPFPDNGWDVARVYPYAEMLARIRERYELIPLATEQAAVAKDFGVTGFQGTLGFVTSMTDSFCGDCNRLRLTADGQLKVCLFSNGERSLRDLLRSGASEEEIEGAIRGALASKWKEHPPMEQLFRLENRRMVQIGG